MAGYPCAAGVVYAWLTRRRRYARRELESRVVRSVGPLEPSKHELKAAVQGFREVDPALGKLFDGARVHDRLRGVLN
jgi:hypothetical protein